MVPFCIAQRWMRPRRLEAITNYGCQKVLRMEKRTGPTVRVHSDATPTIRITPGAYPIYWGKQLNRRLRPRCILSLFTWVNDLFCSRIGLALTGMYAWNILEKSSLLQLQHWTVQNWAKPARFWLDPSRPDLTIRACGKTNQPHARTHTRMVFFHSTRRPCEIFHDVTMRES